MTLENPPFSIGNSWTHSWWMLQPVILVFWGVIPLDPPKIMQRNDMTRNSGFLGRNLSQFFPPQKKTQATPNSIYLGVSKNKGTPKWMGENNGKPYFLMDDLGGTPIFGNIHFLLHPSVPTLSVPFSSNHIFIFKDSTYEMDPETTSLRISRMSYVLQLELFRAAMDEIIAYIYIYKSRHDWVVIVT